MKSRYFFCALLLPLLANCATAQTITGRISGTVLDSTGSALVGAKLTIADADTGTTRSAITDSAGFYAITSLPIGLYTATVSMPGFRMEEQKDLNVVADGRVTADFKLRVGDVNQSVEVVSKSAEQISTDSGEPRQ